MERGSRLAITLGVLAALAATASAYVAWLAYLRSADALDQQEASDEAQIETAAADTWFAMINLTTNHCRDLGAIVPGSAYLDIMTRAINAQASQELDEARRANLQSRLVRILPPECRPLLVTIEDDGTDQPEEATSEHPTSNAITYAVYQNARADGFCVVAFVAAYPRRFIVLSDRDTTGTLLVEWSTLTYDDAVSFTSEGDLWDLRDGGWMFSPTCDHTPAEEPRSYVTAVFDADSRDVQVELLQLQPEDIEVAAPYEDYEAHRNASSSEFGRFTFWQG